MASGAGNFDHRRNACSFRNPCLLDASGCTHVVVGVGGRFFAFFILMLGGVFNLEPIGTDMWGGLPLTVIITLLVWLPRRRLVFC